MLLKDYLDVDKLEQYIAEGLVTRRAHPELPLSILCYSKQATFDNVWDDITIKCRGLIVDDKGVIISRPFEKFFNIDTLDRPETLFTNLPDQHPAVFEKLDGSLGIFYEYKVGNDTFFGVASKGSFTSDHSKWATYWFSKHCKNHQWPAGYTPVFEMIAQAVQRHVVHYEIEDQLVLLALINNETGEEISYNELYHYAFLNGLKTVEIFAKTVSTVLVEDRPNTEGYVLSYWRPNLPPLKIKVKHETFLKLQKIVHAATPKNILEALTNGDYDIIETWTKDAGRPELVSFVEEWQKTFTTAYAGIMLQTKKIVDNALIRNYESRKSVAEFFLTEKDGKYSGLCFMAYDGKDPSQAAWKMVRDEYREELNRPVMGDPDDDDNNGVKLVMEEESYA